jgi:hypothetical protein
LARWNPGYHLRERKIICGVNPGVTRIPSYYVASVRDARAAAHCLDGLNTPGNLIEEVGSGPGGATDDAPVFVTVLHGIEQRVHKADIGGCGSRLRLLSDVRNLAAGFLVPGHSSLLEAGGI